jgi:hypothetical protein
MGPDGRLTLALSLNLEAAMAEIGEGHDETSKSPEASVYDSLRGLSAGDLQGELESFAPVLLQRISLRSDEGPVSLALSAMEISKMGDTSLPRVSQLSLTGSAPAGKSDLYWQVDSRIGDSVIRVRDSISGEIREAQFVLAGDNSGPLSVEGIQPRGWGSVFVNYLEVGFTHIIPKGLDHILFVIGLFLLSTRLNALLWQVSAFTLAHTFTLALSMSGILQLSPSVVEPLIALSIVYVAIENILTDRLHRWRPVVVFCFGLLHGLGFAGVLQEIGPAAGHFLLSLLAFNLGVELGQLAVLVVCYFSLSWLMGRPSYRSVIVIPGSMVIAMIAFTWFIDRVEWY